MLPEIMTIPENSRIYGFLDCYQHFLGIIGYILELLFYSKYFFFSIRFNNNNKTKLMMSIKTYK